MESQLYCNADSLLGKFGLKSLKIVNKVRPSRNTSSQNKKASFTILGRRAFRLGLAHDKSIYKKNNESLYVAKIPVINIFGK